MTPPREVWALVGPAGQVYSVCRDAHDADMIALRRPMETRPTVRRYVLADGDGVTHVPVSSELRDELTSGWSAPVCVRIVDGVLYCKRVSGAA